MGVFMPEVGNWDFISAKYGKNTVSAKFNKGIQNLLIRNDLGDELGEAMDGAMGDETAADTSWGDPENKLMTANFFVRNAVEEVEKPSPQDTTYMPEDMLMTTNFFVRNALEGAIEGDGTQGDSAAGDPENKLMIANFFVRNAVESPIFPQDTTYMPEERYIPIPNTLLTHSEAQNTTNNAILFFMIVGVMGLLVGINLKKQLAAVKENDAFENGEKPLSIGRLDVEFSYGVEIKGCVREDNLQEFFEQMSPIYCEAEVAEKTALVLETAK
jgi:hypothetical protein